MLLTFIRLDDRRYETLIRREDGVSFQVKGVGHMYAIPHDLAHLAIEEALGLHCGFWGSVADGAVFTTMTYLGGRRKPHAAERSKGVLKANEPTIGEAEVLVATFNSALERGYGPDSVFLRERLRERWTPPGRPGRQVSEADISAACDAWLRMRALWQALPLGGALSFVWPTAPNRVRRARRLRHARALRATR